MAEEMRTHPRVDVEPDFCIVETGQKERYLVVVRNLSRCGALIDCGDTANPDSVLVDEYITVVSTPDFLRDALLFVQGRTVWAQGRLLGMQFDAPLDIDQRKLDKLQEYVEFPRGAAWEKF